MKQKGRVNTSGGNMRLLEYDYLVEEAKAIRVAVFVIEQGFTEEFDEIDEVAKHIVIYEKGTPIATCRIYFNSKIDSMVVGRIAVVKQWRGKNIGARVLQEAERIIYRDGGTSAKLSAQMRVAEFYEKQGYVKEGQPYLDEGCPHIWMTKNFKDAK